MKISQYTFISIQNCAENGVSNEVLKLFFYTSSNFNKLKTRAKIYLLSNLASNNNMPMCDLKPNASFLTQETFGHTQILLKI
jgi:hypothetical protein